MGGKTDRVGGVNEGVGLVWSDLTVIFLLLFFERKTNLDTNPELF